MIGAKIHQLRKNKGLTLEELAELIGTSKQTIHRYENGQILNIPHDKIVAIAHALETTPQSLMGWEESTPSFDNVLEISKKPLPLLGEIACGAPIFANEEREAYVAVGRELDADFCLVAKGDSMLGARIFDGDIVFIKAQSALDNGDIGAVIINDEATLKRVYFYPSEEKLVLVAENPKYPPFVYVGRELERIKILGKAVAFQSQIV